MRCREGGKEAERQSGRVAKGGKGRERNKKIEREKKKRDIFLVVTADMIVNIIIYTRLLSP